MSKQSGRYSESANDFLQPNAPTIGTATDVGTGRAYNNGAVTVTFTPDATGSAATSYTATSSPGGFTATGSSSPLTITGLQSGVAYTFTVIATNAIGNSTASAASNSVTATTVPNAPSAVSALDVGANVAWGNAQANISFTAPQTGGKAITSYSATNGTNSNTNSSSPINVAGMQGGTTYNFTVIATNDNGNSIASSSASVTPTTVPGTPSAPSVSSPNPSTSTNVAGASQDVVTWSAPDNGGSAITDYELYDNSSDVGNVGNVTSYTINETGGSNHSFQIAAKNANGTGGTSTSSSTVTTFSFTPFSFAPFGFTPFGFTPFGFTPFGFTPFGFGYGNSLGFLTNVRTPNGLAAAANLQVGDVLLTSNIDGLPTVQGPEDLPILDNWTTSEPNIYGNATTTVTDIKIHMANTIVIVNGEYFTQDHRFMINKNGVMSIVAAVNLNQETDMLWSYASQAWEKISQLQIVENSAYEVVSITTAPIQWFYTEDMLVYESAAETVDFQQNPADAGALANDPTVGGILHTVVFMGNTSDVGSMPVQIAMVSTDLSENTYTKTGYAFTGWNTKPDGSGTTYLDKSSYDFGSDITLYAQWQQA